MVPDTNKILGVLNFAGGLAGVAGTAKYQVIPPFPGPAGSGNSNIKPNSPNRQPGIGVTHISKVYYSTGGSTAQVVSFFRPFNYTWNTTANVASDTVINLFDDPGKYSTNMKYPSSTTWPTSVADSPIATSASSKYLVMQLADGKWWLTKITSVSTLAITITTALPTPTTNTAVMPIGSPVYFFGIPTTQANPQDGELNPKLTVVASSAVGTALLDGGGPGIWGAYNPGDPMIAYTANSTNDGSFDAIIGYYSKF